MTDINMALRVSRQHENGLVLLFRDDGAKDTLLSGASYNARYARGYTEYLGDRWRIRLCHTCDEPKKIAQYLAVTSSQERIPVYSPWTAELENALLDVSDKSGLAGRLLHVYGWTGRIPGCALRSWAVALYLEAPPTVDGLRQAIGRT